MFQRILNLCTNFFHEILFFIRLQMWFPTRQDSATLRGKGTEVRTFIVPGQMDNGTSSKSCLGMGQARTACQNLARDAGRDNQQSLFSFDFLFQNIFFCFRTSFSCFGASFPVLEQPFQIQNTLRNVEKMLMLKNFDFRSDFQN